MLLGHASVPYRWLQVEVGLLLRVLKGAAATNAHVVDVKLTIRQVTGPAGEPQSKPFLSFTASVRRPCSVPLSLLLHRVGCWCSVVGVLPVI